MRVVFLFLIFISSSYSTILLSHNTKTIEINSVEFLKDNSYLFSQIQKKNFTPYEKDSKEFFRFPFQIDNTYWIRLNLTNTLNRALTKILEVEYADLEEVTLFQKSKTPIEFTQERTFQIDLSFLENETKELYIKIENRIGPVIFKLNVMDKNELVKRESRLGILYGLYIGIASIVIIYATIIAIGLKRYIYLIYTLFSLGTLMFIFALSGYLTLFLDIEQLGVSYVIVTSVLIHILSFTIFTVSLLKENLPKYAFYVYGTFTTTAIIGYIVHITNTFSPMLLSISTVTIECFSIFMALYALKKGNRFAIYIFFLSLFSTTGSVLYTLGVIVQVIPLTNFIANSIIFSNLLDLLILLVMFTFYLKSSYEERERATYERLAMEQEIKEKERILFSQSRLATMGETINIIAHQWRQPLAVLGEIFNEYTIHLKFGKKLTDTEKLSLIKEGHSVIKHLSNTIDIFQNYLRADYKLSSEKLCMKEEINKTLQLLAPLLHNQKIEMKTSFAKECYIEGNSNIFNQALINIINNAKDALIMNKIPKPLITITCYKKEENTILEIEDNAGGIDEEIIDKIFEPYTSTKGENGYGTGLFLAKDIIENKMGGKLRCFNTQYGANFILTINNTLNTRSD